MLSEGNVYPISSIFVVLILPIEVLDASRTDPEPTEEETVVIPGIE